MNRWNIRLSVLCIGCTAALLLSPFATTALGITVTESAYTEQAPTHVQPERIDTTPAAGVTDSSPASPVKSNMDKQVQQWIQALSKEKEFAAWKDAVWESYPLGPGTHSWVVILRSGQRELGYLVVSSTEEGSLKLVEYGSGENPLFSLNTLYQSMVQRGLIPDTYTQSDFVIQPPFALTRWYIPPLQGVWQVEDAQEGHRYFDAKTGEELPDISGWIQPLNGEVLSREPAPAPKSDAVIEESAAWEPSDPFKRPGWIKGQSLRLATFGEWKSYLGTQKPPLTYKGKWYGGLATYPLAVSGYHIWSGELPYIKLEHKGSRYVPFDDAALLGGYYPDL